MTDHRLALIRTVGTIVQIAMGIAVLIKLYG